MQLVWDACQKSSLYARYTHKPFAAKLHLICVFKHILLDNSSWTFNFASAGHMTGHSAAKALPCSFCPKSFKTKIQLDIHESRHTGQGKYECSICGKRFPQKGEVKNHEQQHGEERGYTCDHCGKSFARDAYLRIHMKVHAKRGEVPPKPARRYRQILAFLIWN